MRLPPEVVRWMLYTVAGIRNMLPIQHATVVGLRVEEIRIVQLPVNAEIFAVAGRVACIAGLIDKAACRIPAEEVDKVEAMAYDWDASGCEGQGG